MKHGKGEAISQIIFQSAMIVANRSVRGLLVCRHPRDPRLCAQKLPPQAIQLHWTKLKRKAASDDVNGRQGRNTVTLNMTLWLENQITPYRSTTLELQNIHLQQITAFGHAALSVSTFATSGTGFDQVHVGSTGH